MSSPAYAPIATGQGLDAHLVPQLGRIDADLVNDLRIRPRWSVFCAIISCLSLTIYAFTAWLVLQYEKVKVASDKNPIPSLAGDSDTQSVPISTNADVYGRFLVAVLSEAGSFLICIVVLGLWKRRARIPITWSMLCYFVFRGCTLGAILAIFFEIWGINIKMAGEKGQKQSTLRVACTMFVVGLAEETGKLTALGFNLARRLEEVGPANRCCRLCRTLVGNPKSMMIAGVATGFGFMILENFEYFFLNAVAPDLYGPNDNPKAAAEYGDFSRIYTAVTRNILNPHPLFTGLAAGYMCGFYYGPAAIPIGGTLAFFDWCTILGIPIFLHASFDFLITMLADWVSDGLSYVLLTLCIQVVYFFASLALLIRQWRKICTYCPG